MGDTTCTNIGQGSPAPLRSSSSLPFPSSLPFFSLCEGSIKLKLKLLQLKPALEADLCPAALRMAGIAHFLGQAFLVHVFVFNSFSSSFLFFFFLFSLLFLLLCYADQYPCPLHCSQRERSDPGAHLYVCVVGVGQSTFALARTLCVPFVSVSVSAQLKAEQPSGTPLPPARDPTECAPESVKAA